MARRNKKNNYFQMFIENFSYAEQAVHYVAEAYNNFNPDPETLRKQMEELHVIEHTADTKKHELMEKLLKEFITPIEREDIIEIAAAIDDIVDSVEDIFQKTYMYGVTEIRSESFEFLEIALGCLKKLEIIFGEFHDFRKAETIHQAIVELNRLEEEGDVVYMRAMRRLFDEKADAHTTYAWSSLFDHMEMLIDNCESAGDLVEAVIMKNL